MDSITPLEDRPEFADIAQIFKGQQLGDEFSAHFGPEHRFD
jgi:hypothetical protein